MTMNNVFSAEQIRIPPNLADILKEYAKAVIRENPNDILAFSARYFEEAAADFTPEHEGTELSIERLRHVRQRLQNLDLTGTGRHNRDTIIQESEKAGIPPGVILDIFAVGGFSSTFHIAWVDFITLACAKLADSLTATLRECIEAFADNDGEGIPLTRLDEILSCLVRTDKNVMMSDQSTIMNELREALYVVNSVETWFPNQKRADNNGDRSLVRGEDIEKSQTAVSIASPSGQ